MGERNNLLGNTRGGRRERCGRSRYIVVGRGRQGARLFGGMARVAESIQPSRRSIKVEMRDMALGSNVLVQGLPDEAKSQPSFVLFPEIGHPSNEDNC